MISLSKETICESLAMDATNRYLTDDFVCDCSVSDGKWYYEITFLGHQMITKDIAGVLLVKYTIEHVILYQEIIIMVMVVVIEMMLVLHPDHQIVLGKSTGIVFNGFNQKDKQYTEWFISCIIIIRYLGSNMVLNHQNIVQ
eukprot:246371_1